MPTREQLIQNIQAMETQGAQPDEIQSYLDSFKGQKPSSVVSPQPMDISLGEKVGSFLAPTATKAVKKIAGGEMPTGRELLGGALEIGSFAIPGGAVAKGALKAASFGKKVATSAKTFGVAGGLAGAGREIGEGGDLGDVTSATIGGATLGTGAGVALPIVGAGAMAVPKIPAVIKATGGAISTIGEKVSRIPSRTATNVAEMQAKEQVIKSLPTKIAHQSARDGLDPKDIKFMYQIPKEQRAPLKKLADITSKFSKGEIKTDPIELVGQPIVNRIKKLDSEKTKVGIELGKVAKNIGVVTKPELETGVFSALKRVPQLSGIKIKNGKLDFTDTTLLGKETAPDRKALQQAYTQATKWGDGNKAHLYRQTLFEVLGGKKRALQTLTDTQEKGLEAIRRGLGDVLETKNSKYKELSKSFSTKAQPLSDLRKIMRTIPGADEDILNMQAGLLARRITSTAPSNPQIRGILKRMDEATKVKGKTLLSTELLQDFYNILNKYYDIAPKTGYQGQTRTALEGGLVGQITGAIGQVAGQTPAVRQKAIENIIKEALTAGSK